MVRHFLVSPYLPSSMAGTFFSSCMAWRGVVSVLVLSTFFCVLEQVGLSNFWCIYSLYIYFRYPSLSLPFKPFLSRLFKSRSFFFFFFFFLRVASLFFDDSKCGYIRVGKKGWGYVLGMGRYIVGCYQES